MYGFKHNGVGNETACIETKVQSFTKAQQDAVDNWTPKGMGPLEKLIGRWEGSAGVAYTAIPTYDPIREKGRLDLGIGRTPEQPFTDMHSFLIEYKEVIVFTPIKGNVRNRGVSDADPINAACNMDQHIQGVTYNLQIIATGLLQSNKALLDGEPGDIIHEENGMLMYNTVPATGKFC